MFFLIMNKKNIYILVKDEIFSLYDKYSFKNILLCISGGVDSIVLFDIVNNLIKENKIFNYSLLHFNHQQRDSSFKDEKLCKKLSKKYNIPLFLSSLTENKEYASETYMRNKRYEYIYKIKKKFSFDAIFTAHHLDDQIETFYMRQKQTSDNIILSSIRNSYNSLYRPLIKIEKKSLLNYAIERKLVWNDDETNFDNSILRNKIRNKIIPNLISKNNNYKNDIINKINNNKIECDKIVKKVNNFINDKIKVKNNYVYILLNDLKRMNSVIVKYIIKRCYIILNNKEIFFSEKHINSFLDYINNTNNNKYFSFNKTLYSYKINGQLFLFEKKITNSYKIKVESKPINLISGTLKINLNNEINDSFNFIIEKTAYDKGIYVRNWKNGDRISYNKEGNTKKIKKVFSDFKILPFIKETIPLLVDSKDEVLWVIGYQKKYIKSNYINKMISLKWSLKNRH